MPSSISDKHSNSLLLSLFNFLADFDGQISPEATAILKELKNRPDSLPPLYADVLGLPFTATCTELVSRIESLTQEQVAIASYAFQIFRSYEQLLKVRSETMASEQKAAYESQLERVRLVVARTRAAWAEAMSQD
jgi:electron transfer flavoprotein alpha subunit